METVVIKKEAWDDETHDMTRVELENGVAFHIFQHDCGRTSISIHRMSEKTDVTIMGRKVTKKMSQLGNTSLKVVE